MGARDSQGHIFDHTFPSQVHVGLDTCFLSRILKVVEHHGIPIQLDHSALAISFQEHPLRGRVVLVNFLVWKVQSCEQWIF